MGSVVVKWERSVYNEERHEFIRGLVSFLPMMMSEYDCAAMLGMRVKLRDNNDKSRSQFEQFCANRAALNWLTEAIERAASEALAKWNNGDFKWGDGL